MCMPHDVLVSHDRRAFRAEVGSDLGTLPFQFAPALWLGEIPKEELSTADHKVAQGHQEALAARKAAFYHRPHA